MRGVEGLLFRNGTGVVNGMNHGYCANMPEAWEVPTGGRRHQRLIQKVQGDLQAGDFSHNVCSRSFGARLHFPEIFTSHWKSIEHSTLPLGTPNTPVHDALFGCLIIAREVGSMTVVDPSYRRHRGV